MALIWMDGFEHLVTADLPYRYLPGAYGYNGTDATNGRGNGPCLDSTSSGGSVRTPTLTVSGTTVIMGAWCKSHANGCNDNRHFLSIVDPAGGGTFQGMLTRGVNGVLKVWRGWFAAELGSSTNYFGVNQTHYVEFKYVIDASAGSIEVRVDGAPWIGPTSSLNTRGSSTTNWGQLEFGGYIPMLYMDDVYVLDGSGSAPLNDFLGQCRVDSHFATADGATNNWTASAGNRWDCVNDAAPNEDTDYIYTTTVNDKNTFVVEDLKATGSSILGVEVEYDARRLSGGFASVGPVVRHSSTDYDGTGQALAESYLYYRQQYPTNPGTGSAWTEAHFNAAEFGVKKTA